VEGVGEAGARADGKEGNWKLGGSFEQVGSGTKDLPQFSGGFDQPRLLVKVEVV
jgi:hypothetical protein